MNTLTNAAHRRGRRVRPASIVLGMAMMVYGDLLVVRGRWMVDLKRHRLIPKAVRLLLMLAVEARTGDAVGLSAGVYGRRGISAAHTRARDEVLLHTVAGVGVVHVGAAAPSRAR